MSRSFDIKARLWTKRFRDFQASSLSADSSTSTSAVPAHLWRRKLTAVKPANRRAAKLRSSVGSEVPLSHHYVRGAKPILVSIDGELATLKFPNGTIMTGVPIRYLCDDDRYWRN